MSTYFYQMCTFFGLMAVAGFVSVYLERRKARLALDDHVKDVRLRMERLEKQSQGEYYPGVALRLLAKIGEDDDLFRGKAIEALEVGLLHKDPTPRNVAAEGLWQLHSFDSLTKIEKALEVETHPGVRDTLRHVCKVLGGSCEES